MFFSHRTGKPVEICFFPVPNIEEVQFGTALNKAFGTEVAKDLGMGDYKPGSTIRTYLVQYSNVYWAKKARGEGGEDHLFVLIVVGCVGDFVGVGVMAFLPW